MQIKKIEYYKGLFEKLAFSEEFSQELQQIWQQNDWKGYAYVAYSSNQEPVGYILYQNTNTIRGFFIATSERGKGIGTELLQHVCNDNADSLIKVNITVGSEKVYQNLNFILLGPRKDFPGLIVAYKGNPSEAELKKMREKL